MGFNSVLIVMNDSLHVIEKDPEFGRKVSEAIGKYYGSDRNLGERGHIDISCSGHVNAASVIGCQHADVTQILAVGQNYATSLGNYYWGRHLEREDQIQLLRMVAEEYGYSLRKKKV